MQTIHNMCCKHVLPFPLPTPPHFGCAKLEKGNCTGPDQLFELAYHKRCHYEESTEYRLVHCSLRLIFSIILIASFVHCIVIENIQTCLKDMQVLPFPFGKHVV